MTFNLKIVLTAAAVFFSAANVAAQSCNKVDLNESSDSPFYKIPIYDQGATGTCYAHVAAQMASYYLLKTNQTEGTVNPFYVAMLASEVGIGDILSYPFIFPHQDLSVMYGGYPDDAMSVLADEGVCLDSELGSLWQGYSSQFSSEAGAIMSLENKTKLFSEMVSCSPASVNLPKIKSMRSGLDIQIQKKLKEAMSKEWPVGINLASNQIFFKDPENTRVLAGKMAPIKRGSMGNMYIPSEVHNLMVTARKEINGECHLQIRNSHGKWRGEGATACACINQRGEYQASCTETEVQEYVGCWYKESDVIPNTTDIYWIKEK